MLISTYKNLINKITAICFISRWVMKQDEMTKFLDIISRIFTILTWILGLLFCVYIFNPILYSSYVIDQVNIYTLFVAIVSAIAGFLVGRFRLL